jgi:flagellar export protein FliJ
MYEFKFKTILKYKKQIEESLQQDFAASKKRWTIERDKLETCYERWQKYIHDWREAQKGSLSIIEVDLYQDYMVALKQQMTAQSEVVKSCLEDMDKKRMLLLEGVKERKTLEQLDEKYLSEYLDHHKKLESEFLNDIATIRYNLDRAES